jgi:hypothetical protein
MPDTVNILNWIHLSRNPNAISLLKQVTNNFTKKFKNLSWENICDNPNAIQIVEQFIHQKRLYRINWDKLSQNPNAIHLLKSNQHKINWTAFSFNESIVEDDATRYQMWLKYMTNFVYHL